MQKISNSVYVELGTRGSNNSFVVTEEGLVMIDTPMFPSDAIKWRETMAKFGPMRYIINTEPHGDHVSGNGFFDGIVIAHEGTRQAVLSSTVEQYRESMARMGPQSKEVVPDDFKIKPPTITFNSRLTFYLGKHTFELISLPGHTPFQIAVYVPEEKVVFTSDNVTNGVPPFMHQALPSEWISSLKWLKTLDVEKVVPGHGQVCGPEQFDVVIDIIQRAVEIMKSAINKGMTLEEIQKNVNILERFPKNEMTAGMMGVSIARLYEVLKGK